MRKLGPLSNPSRGLSFHPGWVYGISKISPISQISGPVSTQIPTVLGN